MIPLSLQLLVNHSIVRTLSSIVRSKYLSDKLEYRNLESDFGTMDHYLHDATLVMNVQPRNASADDPAIRTSEIKMWGECLKRFHLRSEAGYYRGTPASLSNNA